MGVLWGKIWEGVVQYWPLTNSFFLLGVFMSVPILVKINQEMRPWECSQTGRYTDTLTDANRFYNLSHVICYSYGTDNDQIKFKKIQQIIFQIFSTLKHSMYTHRIQYCFLHTTKIVARSLYGPNNVPCRQTYWPIRSADSGERPFSFIISFLTSSHGVCSVTNHNSVSS